MRKARSRGQQSTAMGSGGAVISVGTVVSQGPEKTALIQELVLKLSKWLQIYSVWL